MVILTCPECEGSHIIRYEGKMTDKGYDWFTCTHCKHNFTLKQASYREENDLFE
jgi:transposase-like protein